MGAGYGQTMANTMVLEAFHVLFFLCFLLFREPFWTLLLFILGVLGRYFDTEKVDANFD